MWLHLFIFNCWLLDSLIIEENKVAIENFVLYFSYKYV